MSALSERLVVEHEKTPFDSCSCGGWAPGKGAGPVNFVEHLIEVAERETRKSVADELDAKVIHGAGGHPYDETSRAFEAAARFVRKSTS